MASIRIPENGPGGVEFQESFFDEIHGTLHKRKDIRVDRDGRIRDRRDLGAQSLDRDDFSSYYSPRHRRFQEP